jgi:2-iminobutanoate/2-iminopropanoate deaminase
MTVRLIPLSIGLLHLLFAGCGPTEEDVRRIVSEEMRKGLERTTVSPVDVIGPYSPAVRVGGFLFVSGQIGMDRETGHLRNESIETETRQVMENLMHILRSAGYDSSHVVSATVYLKNMNDYAKMNLIYGGYFPDDRYPARAAVAVNELPRQANVEIAVVAYK